MPVKKNNIFIIFCFLTISVSCQGMENTWNRLFSIDNFKDLKTKTNEQIATTNGEVLVIFDVDDVIFNTSAFLSEKRMTKEILKQQFPEYDEKTIEKFCRICYKNATLPLMNEKMPNFIKKLQEKPNVTVICLTNHPIGPRLFNISYEDERIGMLKHYGLNFSHAFPNYYNNHVLFTLTNMRNHSFFRKIDIEDDCFMPPRYYNFKYSILYKKGIQFANWFVKHIVLKTLLQTLDKKNGYVPKGGVVVIDDQKDNLIPMKQLFSKKGLPYILIHDARNKKNDNENILESAKKRIKETSRLFEKETTN